MDLVVLIDSPGFEALGTGRVIKPVQAAAVSEAGELLRLARERDRQMHEQMHSAYEQARQSGWQAGLRQAQDDMAQRLAVAQAARQLALQDLTPTLVEIVADAVALLVKGAPRRALLASALDSVSGMLRQARWARLRVHPSQAEEARAALAESRAALAAADIVTVLGDMSIDVDGCIFETDVGMADASLGVQLAAIRSAVGAAVAAIAPRPAEPAAVAAARQPEAETADAPP